MIRVLVLIASLVLLSACAGSPGNDSSSDSSARQTAEINTSLGREYMDRGQYEIALDKLKKATRAEPSYVPAHTVLAVLYEQIREPDLAEEHYRKAVELAPDNGDVNNNFGVFLCQSGREEQAVGYFLKATDDPFYRTPAVALTNAGGCELQARNLDNAERYLRQSLEYDAEFADTLLAMANVSFLKGESFSARAFLQRFESAATATAESLDLGVRIETGLGNSNGAREYEEELLARFPGSDQANEIRAKQR